MAFMRSGVRSPSAPPKSEGSRQKAVSSGQKPDRSRKPVSRRYSLDLITAAFLFVATCAVVVWQNSRLGVLWDLSYVLENAHRISLGDIPYRDFPFPYAPLTFLIQVALIKLTGRVFWHHILYCAAAGGLGTVLTWRLLHLSPPFL